MKKILIEVNNIHKVYKMGKVEVKALNGVTLTINAGDFVVILGPSGSGKSTLLHLLGALDHPTSGSVLIDNRKISDLDDLELAMLRRKKMGFIFQAFNLIPTLTALENILIPTMPMKLDEVDTENKAIALLKLVEIDDRMNHKPGELSGGQQQRVSIARSLINDPEIIYADEPTGNLDSITGQKIVKLMKQLSVEKGKTFVIVTHDPSLIAFANRVFYLRDGKIQKDHNKEINLLKKIAKNKK